MAKLPGMASPKDLPMLKISAPLQENLQRRFYPQLMEIAKDRWTSWEEIAEKRHRMAFGCVEIYSLMHIFSCTPWIRLVLYSVDFQWCFIVKCSQPREIREDGYTMVKIYTDFQLVMI